MGGGGEGGRLGRLQQETEWTVSIRRQNGPMAAGNKIDRWHQETKWTVDSRRQNGPLTAGDKMDRCRSSAAWPTSLRGHYQLRVKFLFESFSTNMFTTPVNVWQVSQITLYSKNF